MGVFNLRSPNHHYLTFHLEVPGMGWEHIILHKRAAHRKHARVACISKHCVLNFCPQFSKKDVGVYKATISDDRGQDESQVDISGKGNSALTSDCCSLANISALKKTLSLLYLFFYLQSLTTSLTISPILLVGITFAWQHANLWSRNEVSI